MPGRTNILVYGSRSSGSGGGGYDGTVDLPDNIGKIVVSGYNGTATVTITYEDTEKELLTGVHVVYKTGGYPTSPTDGAYVRIPASGSSVEITGLDNEVKYYFRAYPYRTVDGTDYYQTCEPSLSKTDYTLFASEWGLKKIADDLGQTSDMVRIPKQTWAELGVGDSTEIFPAFIVNGEEVDALYVGKYEASEANSRAYSTKGELPKASITFDNASKLCTDKGEGWHMMTRLEWAAVMLWCFKNGYQPLGNNDYGKDITETEYSTDDGAKSSGVIATGAGPVTWSHNGAEDGIWDLNGNVFEWQAGMRLYNGELQVISMDGVTFGNDAAVTDSASDSAYWYCINGSTGALMTPNGSGTTSGSIRCSSDGWTTGTASNYSGGTDGFYNYAITSTIGTKAKYVLQALGLYKPDTLTETNGDHMYLSKSGEILANAGGYWSNGAGAGVSCLSGGSSRTHTSTSIGFRPAFVELKTDA